MLRTLLLLPIGAAALACATAMEATFRLDVALEAIAAAQLVEDKETSDELLADAADRLETSWAKPLFWNAHANEALSAIHALRYEASGNPAFLAQSAIAARRALGLSPVLPQTWIRSAQLALLAAPAAPCSALQCLEISWQISPISDPQTDCVRIQLAHEAGMDESRLGQRIMTYARTDVATDAIMQCLDFITPEQRFDYIVRARGHSNATR